MISEPTHHIINADARTTGLPERFFHCVATSPPYFGLREYGEDAREIGKESTPEEYVGEMVAVGREVHRVLRDDGTWWLNLGDSYANDAKWGGHSGGKHVSALHGNTGVGRGKKKTGVPAKSLLMMPQRVALALQAEGWIVRAQIPWIKANAMPESVADRPSVAHEYVFLLAKSQQYFWDADAVRVGNSRNVRTTDWFNDSLDEYESHMASVRQNGGLLLSPTGDPLAFMVNPIGNKLAHFAMWPPRLVAPMIKASTSEKGCCPKCGAQWVRVREVVGAQKVRNGPGPDKHTEAVGGKGKTSCMHTGTVPIYETVGWQPLCDCATHEPVPCRVLDPFAGSGTTLQVCEALGRDSWGVELMAKNIPIIGERLKEKLDPKSLTPIARQVVSESQTSLPWT